MASPIVYGPNFSTYVRATRLTLAEKPAPYQLVEVAMMQGAHKQDDFLKRNPFGKVPAFEHDDVRLYETSAIIRYIDRAFGGARLQPSDVKQLAKMDQAISIVDRTAGVVRSPGGRSRWRRWAILAVQRACGSS